MNNPEDKYQEIDKIERRLREQELELKRGKLEHELNSQDGEFYKTTKHSSKISFLSLKNKIFIGIKLFALVVVAITAVRVASVLSGFIIVGLLVFVSYKLFFSDKK